MQGIVWMHEFEAAVRRWFWDEGVKLRTIEALCYEEYPGTRANWKRWLVKTIYLSVLAGLCFGCALVPPDRYRPLAFDAEQEALIERAATAWCTASWGECCPERSHELVEDEVILRPGEPEECLGTVKSSCKGYYQHETPQPFFNPAQIVLITSKLSTQTSFYATILHEFGHHCGCGHTTFGVMNPYAPAVEILESDTNACELGLGQ